MNSRRAFVKIMLVVVAVLSLSSASRPCGASGGSSTWPVAIAPVPSPGTIISNTNKKFVTTSTNTVQVALAGLDQAYTDLGWTLGAAVNQPRTYTKVISGKTIKIIVNFAALDPTPANGFIRSQFTQTWNQL